MKLFTAPTPVDDAPRLSDALGVNICVKRDDLTGLGLGGNKVRKLEYFCAEALEQGCDTLVTGGGVQSNHVRQTAAAAARLGLDAHVLLASSVPEDFERPSGNVLLDVLFGASIEVTEPDDFASIDRAIIDAAGRLAASGRRPYAIPLGGAAPPGVRAYEHAGHELREQRPDVDIVFVASGTGGTQAGLMASGLDVVGIDVGARPDLEGAITRLSAGTAAPVVDHDHVGPGYAGADDATFDALTLAARTEGLVLDPAYTAKAMAALVAWAREGRLDASVCVCFWHTGGQPALFASRYQEWFRS